MSSQRPSVRLRLTSDQRDQVRKATGRSAEAIELSIEELEERIAPVTMSDITITKSIGKATP